MQITDEFSLSMARFYQPAMVVHIFWIFFLLFLEDVHLQGCGRSFVRNPLLPMDEEGTSKEGAWPWIVWLIETSNDKIMGSGFLIDRKHVLSAAHCFDQTKTFYVRAGSTNLYEAVRYNISKLEVHPSYKHGEYFFHDIAVVTLLDEIALPTVVPICLPSEEIINKNLTGLEATEAGVPMAFDSPRLSTLSHLSHFRIKSNSECNAIYEHIGDNYVFDETTMCAIAPEAYRQCSTLSGSPLMIQHQRLWYAVGIVSFGYCNPTVSIPSGYTRLSNYVAWIKSVIL